jgi:phosphoribosyl 1,2-cyclic phosphate phosphodiesterase
LNLVFLGTGAAWGVPEAGCPCRICQKMRSLNEERLRSAYLLKGKETILLDCGPDIRRQLNGLAIDRLDAILISHEHADHYLGLDDLLAFRRRLPKELWRLIPTYATQAAWDVITKTFGYLCGSLLEPRIAQPGERLAGLQTPVYPFKTFHGDSASGSVGFIVEQEPSSLSRRLVYTSDFFDVPFDEPRLQAPDTLIIQSHWVNEPLVNRANCMSLERGLKFIQAWKPKECVFLTHISEAYPLEGDPANGALKKLVPKKTLKDPETQLPYPLPTCQAEWQALAEKVFRDQKIPVPVVVPSDGLEVRLW